MAHNATNEAEANFIMLNYRNSYWIQHTTENQFSFSLNLYHFNRNKEFINDMFDTIGETLTHGACMTMHKIEPDLKLSKRVR